MKSTMIVVAILTLVSCNDSPPCGKDTIAKEGVCVPSFAKITCTEGTSLLANDKGDLGICVPTLRLQCGTNTKLYPNTIEADGTVSSGVCKADLPSLVTCDPPMVCGQGTHESFPGDGTTECRPDSSIVDCGDVAYEDSEGVCQTVDVMMTHIGKDQRLLPQPRLFMQGHFGGLLNWTSSLNIFADYGPIQDSAISSLQIKELEFEIVCSGPDTCSEIELQHKVESDTDSEYYNKFINDQLEVTEVNWSGSSSKTFRVTAKLDQVRVGWGMSSAWFSLSINTSKAQPGDFLQVHLTGATWQAISWTGALVPSGSYPEVRITHANLDSSVIQTFPINP